MADFELKWQISGAGSADFTWDFPQDTVKVHTTYTGDGLGSVLQAALDLRVGSSSAIAFLPAEPGGTCLFFAGADEEVYLQIVHFSDMESEQRRWSGGSLRWHGRISVNHYIREVTLLAEGVLVQYGNTEAYSKSWGGFPFPMEKLELLRGVS